MKKRIYFLIILSLLAGLLSAEGSDGPAMPITESGELPDSLRVDLDEASQLDSLFYAADSIRAHRKDEQIWLFGNSSIDYGGSQIQADSLFLDLKKEQAISFGVTLMQDNGQLLIGEDVRYDVNNQTGFLRQGQSMIEKGYYKGEEIRKIGSSTYDIDGARFTTCDLQEPDYWFRAKQMRIYHRDKVVGKHVVAYVNHLPIFYFPFVTMSIKRGRHPGFLIPEPGYNNVDGKYIHDLAYFYPYKEFADFTMGFDLMEKTGWKANFGSRYIKRYFFSGGLNASYQKNIGYAGKKYDWSLRANHHHDLPEKSSLDVSLDFISNKRIWEGSDLVDESLAQRLNSSISYRKPFGNTYFNAGALYNQDLINDSATLSLPSASWSVSSRPVYELLGQAATVWYSGLSYNYRVRLHHSGYLDTKDSSLMDYIWANTIDPADSTRYSAEHHFGIAQNLGLSHSYNYRGWLNLRQSVDYSESWFDRNRDQKKWVRGNDYSASMNASFNVYGIRTFEKTALSAIRHTMTPGVGLTYIPDHSDNDEFYSFGGISLRKNKKQANLSFSLAQKWQLKFGSASSERKINDLFSWNSRISANLIEDDKPFGNFSHTFGFRPGTFKLGEINHNGWKLDGLSLQYSNRLSLIQDTYQIGPEGLAIKNQYFSQTLGLSGNAPYANYFPKPKNRTFSVFGEESGTPAPSQSQGAWNLGITHDLYAPKSLLQSKTENLRMNAAFQLTDNYSLSYSSFYNIKDKKLISQGLSLTRDLHCWKLDFSFTKRNEYWDYRIVFYNVHFPDALRFKTRDSKRY